MNETLKTIFARASVRAYTPEPVSEEELNLLLRAAMAAPTGKNCQPWRFVVVRGREVLDSLAGELPHAKMLLTAPLAIVVCGDTSAAVNTAPDLWIQDCSAATENILLAAASLGLGTCWTAAWPYEERYSVVRRALDLPEHIVPLNVIPVGHPAGGTPKEKYNEENVHYEKW